MNNHTYLCITISLSALDTAAMVSAVGTACRLSTAALQRILTSAPCPEASSGEDGCAVRLMDGRPCLVYEDTAATSAGAPIEEALRAAQVPYLLVHGPAADFGASSTVCYGNTTEHMRLDFDLNPIVGIVARTGDQCSIIDADEIDAVERHERLRRILLGLPIRRPSLTD